MGKRNFSDEIACFREMLIAAADSGLITDVKSAALLALAVEEYWCDIVASLGLYEDDVIHVFEDTRLNPPLSNPEHRELIELLGLGFIPGDEDEDTVVEDVEAEGAVA